MSRTRLLLVLAMAACGVFGGCDASTAHEDSATSGAALQDPSLNGVIYFHGLSQLGFSDAALRDAVGSDAEFLAPKLSDNQILGAPTAPMVAFANRHRNVTVGGYSAGRMPAFVFMQRYAASVTRVVMIDPTYDSDARLQNGIGGGIARAWLDEDVNRTFMLVYGDATRSLAGQNSYIDALADHPRAVLCELPGGHDRFRAADMAYALAATDCADLEAHLN